MLMSKITIACVLRTPDQNVPESKKKHYGPSDVLKLKKAFETFLSIDHDFVCLTDQEIPGVKTIPLIGNTPNWWAKIELFRPGLFAGPVFYCDLDMVICNPLDEMMLLLPGDNFLMLNHGSGVLYWEGDYSFLWDRYLQNPFDTWKQYSKKPKIGDQGFIYDNVENKKSIFMIEGFNKNWLFLYKGNVHPPKESKILIFNGYKHKPNKGGYDSHPLIKKYWTDIL
jgi:hypothetical protein